MDAIEYLKTTYKVDLNQRSPIEIPNFDRKQLAQLFHQLEFKIGVEIGVERGSYSKILCKYNPQAKIYLVDPWQAYRGYYDHRNQNKLNRFHREAKENLASFSNYKIIKKFSMEAVKDFKDRSLDFVYIDGNHSLPFVINDIHEWSKKVRVGGIVAGHDYRRDKSWRTRNHVVDAVNCYTYSYRIKPWFILGLKSEAPESERDRVRSWMWII